MKFIKRLGLHAVAFIIATSFTHCFAMQANAIGSDQASWTETVDSTNYDTWRQDIDCDYGVKDWLTYNLQNDAITLSNIKSFDFKSTKGMEPPNGSTQSYTVRRWGSLLFALSKLMVASGAVEEYDVDNTNGINPGILYYSALLTDENKLDGYKIPYTTVADGNATVSVYSQLVTEWYDEPEMLMDTIKLYWGTNITLENNENIRKLEDEAKKEIIKGYLDEGQYVIVAVDEYRYFDTASNAVVNGHEDAVHSVFLTGYVEDEASGEITFNMDDSLSPSTEFLDVYTLESIRTVSTFNPTPEIESKLDFYKDKYVSEPWYLRLISKDKPISPTQVMLIPLTKVGAESGSSMDVAMNMLSNAVQSIPNGETSVETSIDTVMIDTRILSDTKKMMEALHSAITEETAILDIGFRSIDDQDALYEQMSITYGDEVDKYSDKGGESEHNAGISIDFKVEGVEDFSTTKSYRWLCEHAHEYGFILRYPNSSKAIETTGKNFNASHWRYIGKEHAVEFVKFIDASYKEDAEGNISNVEAYLNISYNGKVYEDYYLEVVLPLYTNADLSEIDDTDDLDNLEEEKPKYSDATLRRVNYLIRHPVKAIGNFLAGLAQMAHNAIAVGDTGNILNISWLLSWDTVRQIVFPYIIISTIVVVIAMVLRYLRYMINVNDNLMAILRDSGSYIVVSIIPLLLISFVGNCFDGLTGIITKDMSGKIVMLEVTYEEPDPNDDETITSWELITDEDLSKSLFRETFIDSDNGSSYEFATVQMPIGYDGNSIVYKNMTITELFESVSYDTIIDGMISQRLSNETGEIASTASFYNSTSGITEANLATAVIDTAAPRYLYYSCNEFVPVNYNKYGDSVFYYFYDWVKYQYLSYWAHNKNENGKVISNFAKGFVLPGEEFDESLFTVETLGMYDDSSFDNYTNRIEMLEELYLSNAHSGVYLMYNDMDYVRNNSIYYNDVFGLSYLFNMTSGQSDTTYAMVDDYYKNTQDIEVWAGVNKINYTNTMPDYNTFRAQIQSGNYKYTTIQPLTGIINGPAWNIYKESSYLRDKHENGMAYYTFTPSYLADKFNQPLDKVISTTAEGRIPWRVYASNAQLHEAYKDETVQWTKLEQQLCALNEQIYKDVHELAEYMPGQITDDVMIFVTALAATARFNEMFDGYNTPVYPKGIATSNLDMDKIIRLTYADTLVTNESLDTMYMIYDSPGGLAVVLIVLLSEILMLVASATRAMLLVMFFVGVVLLTLNYLRGQMPLRSNLFTGVIWQFLSLLLMHALLIGTNMLVFTILVEEDSAAMRVVISILGLVLYFIVAVVNLAMLKVFIKDVKNFGGVVLKNSVQTVKSQIDLADAETTKQQTQIDMENAELQLQRREERRQSNRDKLEKYLDFRTRRVDRQARRNSRHIKRVRGNAISRTAGKVRYTVKYKGKDKPDSSKDK